MSKPSSPLLLAALAWALAAASPAAADPKVWVTGVLERDAAQPTLTVNESGAVLVAWAENEFFDPAPMAGGDFGVEVAAVSAEGVVGPVQEVFDSTHNPIVHDVELNERGDAAVVWNGTPTGTEHHQAYLAVRRPGGAFGPPLPLGPGSRDARVEVDDAGNVLVVWHVQQADTVDTPIQAAWYRAGDSQLGPPLTIADEGTGTALAVTEGRLFVLLWTARRGDPDDPYSRELRSAWSSANSGWSPSVAVSDHDSATQWGLAEVVANRRGDVIASWGGWLAIRRPGGGFGSPQPGIGGPVNLDPHGNAIVASHGLASTLAAADTRFADPQPLLAAAGTASALLDGFGNLVVLSQPDSSPADPRVRLLATVRDRDGSWGEQVLLTEEGHQGSDFDIASDPQGQPTAVWTDSHPRADQRLVWDVRIATYSARRYEAAATPQIGAFRLSPRDGPGAALAAWAPRVIEPRVAHYTLSKRAEVRVILRRVAHPRSRCRGPNGIRCGRVATLRHRGRAGTNRVRLARRTVRALSAPGRYRAVVTATDSVGRRASRTFKVSRIRR